MALPARGPTHPAISNALETDDALPLKPMKVTHYLYGECSI